jgi:hypothetical protein
MSRTPDTANLSGSPHRPRPTRHEVSFVWGLLGVIALFSYAVVRLGARGVAAIAGGLSAFEWAALAALTAAFVYGEGVRALQRRWVPWVIARLELLHNEPRAWYRVLAPLHAMAFIGAPVRLIAAAWAGSIAIVIAVLIVSRFPDPWRGIVDFAVASALAWATFALITQGMRSLRR